MAHSHSHGGESGHLHVPAALRRTLTVSLVPVLVFVLVGVIVLWPRGAGPDLSTLFGHQHLVKGTITGISESTCEGAPADSGQFCQKVRVKVQGGPDKGRTVSIESGGSVSAARLHRGDGIVLGSDGSGAQRRYYFADFDRDTPILILLVLFAGAALVFGRWSGLRALLALAASLLALTSFVIPSVLHGHSPIAVALVGSALIMLVVLYVTGGLNTQSTVAVLGTMVSLALIALLAWVFVQTSKLTGLADEDALFLSAANGNINLQGLLLGGIIIGSLGVLDDMTVTQVSTVWELRRARDDWSLGGLYQAAERVGRDHIASTVNTLVLAYAGASLPLLIYFTQAKLHLGQVMTSEVIAVEIVRTLVGSVGLIASVPITTLLAAYVVTRPHVEPEADDGEPPARPRPPKRRASPLAGLRQRRPPRPKPEPRAWIPPKAEREFRDHQE